MTGTPEDERRRLEAMGVEPELPGLERIDPWAELEHIIEDGRGQALDGDLERRKNKLALELDDVPITGRYRAEMMAEPDAAFETLEASRRAPGVLRNPAGYITAIWKRRHNRPAPEPEPEHGPPTLSALEFHWSRETAGHPAMAGLERLMGAAIGQAGGFRALLERGDWLERQTFDEGGGLLPAGLTDLERRTLEAEAASAYCAKCGAEIVPAERYRSYIDKKPVCRNCKQLSLVQT